MQTKRINGWLALVNNTMLLFSKWMEKYEISWIWYSAFEFVTSIGPIMKYSNRDILKSKTCISLIKHSFVCFVFSLVWWGSLSHPFCFSFTHTHIHNNEASLLYSVWHLFSSFPPPIITNQRNCIVFFNVQFSMHA